MEKEDFIFFNKIGYIRIYLHYALGLPWVYMLEKSPDMYNCIPVEEAYTVRYTHLRNRLLYGKE